MAHLIDTNVLARLANTADASHAVAARAVLELHRRGEALHLTAQVLIEFRNVATRPTAVNGLGLSTAVAESQAAGFVASFPLLAETSGIFPAWKALVESLGSLASRSMTPAWLRSATLTG
jgi:predicted nucleic acid-binding protein